MGYIYPYASGNKIIYDGVQYASSNQYQLATTKFSVQCPSYGSLTLNGAVYPGGASNVMVAQRRRGVTLRVRFTLTGAANSTADQKVPRKDYQWANYNVEVVLPGPVVGNIIKPTMAKGRAPAEIMGNTLVWQDVPMPVNAPMAYKRTFSFKAKVDETYTGTLSFGVLAYNDDTLASTTLTVSTLVWTSPRCGAEGRRKRCPPHARNVTTTKSSSCFPHPRLTS